MPNQNVNLGHSLKIVSKALLAGVIGAMLLVPSAAAFVWLLLGNAPVLVYVVIYIAVTCGILWGMSRASTREQSKKSRLKP